MKMNPAEAKAAWAFTAEEMLVVSVWGSRGRDNMNAVMSELIRRPAEGCFRLIHGTDSGDKALCGVHRYP
jgi:hypothetical protein